VPGLGKFHVWVQNSVVISAEDRRQGWFSSFGPEPDCPEWVTIFMKKKEEKRAEIEPCDFWVIPKIVLQNIHKLAVIFSLVRNTLKGNDLIFNSVVHAIWSYNERWDFPTAGSSLFLPRFSLLTFLRFLGLFFIFSEIFKSGVL
jgi:hypothetical protein